MNNVKAHSSRLQEQKHRKLASIIALLVVGMIGLSYASVPLYELFCRVTGFGGTPERISIANIEHGSTVVVGSKKYKIDLDSNVAHGLDWQFHAVERQFELVAGQFQKIEYRAYNNANRALSGTSSFNITPLKVAKYFKKIECFCFVEQILEPKEEAFLPVQFYIDPAITDDLDMADVSHITMSYTFFPTKE